MFFIIPCVDIYEVIDMRVQNFSVPPQEVGRYPSVYLFPQDRLSCQILTKDSVTVFVNAIMYYKVQVSCDWSACSHVTPAPPLIGQDAIRAVTNVDDYAGSAQALAATTLRNVLGTRNLAEILAERESISRVMQDALDEATDPWGVKAERVEM